MDGQTDGCPLPAHPPPLSLRRQRDVNLEVAVNTHQQAVLLVGDCRGFFISLPQTDGRPGAVNTPIHSLTPAALRSVLPHLGLQRGGRWVSSEPPLCVGRCANAVLGVCNATPSSPSPSMGTTFSASLWVRVRKTRWDNSSAQEFPLQKGFFFFPWGFFNDFPPHLPWVEPPKGAAMRRRALICMDG